MIHLNLKIEILKEYFLILHGKVIQTYAPCMKATLYRKTQIYENLVDKDRK